MNHTGLRWKGRIGALKPLAVLAILITGSLLIAGLATGISALKNPDGTPQTVTITALVAGEVEAGRYVSVEGHPIYQAAYEYSEDGRLTKQYYFLVDSATGEAILVLSDRLYVEVRQRTGKSVVLVGMTRTTSSDLRNLMEEDLPELRRAGLDTNVRLYIGENQTPPDLLTSASLFLMGSVGTLLAAAVFFFPSIVFGPAQVDMTAPLPPAPKKSTPPVRATGRFLQLNSLQPLEWGKRQQKFTNANTNIIVPESEAYLLLHIHHIVKTQTYGITINTRESDWGLLFTPQNTVMVETGKVYSWKEKWAARLTYWDAEQEKQTLVLTFNHESVLRNFIELARELRLPVSRGTFPY